MTLVDQAAKLRKRERRDGPINPIGVTVHDVIVWRIGDGPHRETPSRAVVAAERRVYNTADGQTRLSGEIVNGSDLIALLGELRLALNGKKPRICPSDFTDLGPDGHCPECIAEQTRWDH